MTAVAVVLIGFGAGMATMAIVSFYKKFLEFWKKY
jgi:hypothetical protein